MVSELIGRARRRYIFQESLAQLALAASFAVAGLALLLLFGTAYLDWWSVVLLGLAGLGLGVWRVRARIPSAYAMALRLDQNAGLHDCLSTAVYFDGRSGESNEFLKAQRLQAQGVADKVNLDQAVPFSTPKALYTMAALCLLATGLFALRYHLTQRLDLRAPLTQVLFEDQENPALAKAKQKAAQAKSNRKLSGMESLMAKLGVSLNQEDQKTPDSLDQAIQDAMRSPGAPGEGDKKGQAPGAGKESKSAAPGEQASKGDPMDGGQPDKSAKDSESKSAAGDKDAKSGEQGNNKSGNSGDNGSLLSKMKDAVSNIFSKAKQDANGQQKGGQQQQGGQQQAKSEKGASEKGKSGQGQQQGQEQASSQEGDPNGDSQEGQQSQGKSGAKDSNQQASSQPGSGIGHQDGAKDLKAAEQLKAMGKLSEIIGRRAQTVSGETSIEVQSGSQQLKTAYSKTSASHAETDGDVNRDEVPVALQSYVQQYFQQVRKTAATPGGAAVKVNDSSKAADKKLPTP